MTTTLKQRLETELDSLIQNAEKRTYEKVMQVLINQVENSNIQQPLISFRTTWEEFQTKFLNR